MFILREFQLATNHEVVSTEMDLLREYRDEGFLVSRGQTLSAPAAYRPEIISAANKHRAYNFRSISGCAERVWPRETKGFLHFAPISTPCCRLHVILTSSTSWTVAFVTKGPCCVVPVDIKYVILFTVTKKISC